MNFIYIYILGNINFHGSWILIENGTDKSNLFPCILNSIFSVSYTHQTSPSFNKKDHDDKKRLSSIY